jgi:energy-coupling factor transporter ATP-binding protein EcfA2
MVGLPAAPDRPPDGLPGWPDLALVRGQEAAKRALEVAAAGGHSILLAGPMGAGKTMLARCLPGILPALTADEVSEIADLYARAGLQPPSDSRRPFRRVEPTLRLAELVGTPRRPGEVSLAGRGVLLLDDLRAHRGIVLRAISRIVEERTGTVFAGPRSFEFPARFQLIATAPPEDRKQRQYLLCYLTCRLRDHARDSSVATSSFSASSSAASRSSLTWLTEVGAQPAAGAAEAVGEATAVRRYASCPTAIDADQVRERGVDRECLGEFFLPLCVSYAR